MKVMVDVVTDDGRAITKSIGVELEKTPAGWHAGELRWLVRESVPPNTNVHIRFRTLAGDPIMGHCVGKIFYIEAGMHFIVPDNHVFGLI